VLGASNGGSGQNTVTTGDLLYGSATNTWSKLSIGSTGTILRVVGGIPSWGTDYTGTVTSVDASVPSFLSISGNPITTSGTLAITYSGTALPVANGGTGLTSLPANYIAYGNGTGAFSSSSTLTYNGTTLFAGNFVPSSSSVPTNGLFLPATNTIGWSTNSSQRMQIGATGGVSIGNTTDPGATNLSVTGSTTAASFSTAGNLTFTGTSNRILGDMSTATLINRLAFQTSTTNGTTAFVILPNGTSAVARFQAYNNSDPTNASQAQFSVESTSDVRLSSGRTGTGTYLPLTIYAGGSERARVFTSGGVSIGNTTDPGATNLSVSGTINTSGYTVATLPTGVTGARAYVTNALTPTFGATVVGGGAVTIPVFYNGTNWIVG